MRLLSKKLLTGGGYQNPFLEIHGLRCTVQADYLSKTFYLTVDNNYNSWGIGFELKGGFTAERPIVEGISLGIIDGIYYWVSARGRLATHDYFFEIKKNGVVADKYRIIYII